MRGDMDHEEVVHEIVHVLEIERLAKGKKLYVFGDDEHGGSLYDRVQHTVYNEQRVADLIASFYEDENTSEAANLHELLVSATVLRSFTKLFGAQPGELLDVEVATVQRCTDNMWGLDMWDWKEKFHWVRDEFEKYMTSSIVGKRADELTIELKRLHDSWARNGEIDWDGCLPMDEQDRYNVAYIAGTFDHIIRAVRTVGSKWESGTIPYAIHSAQNWFIVAHESYPSAGSHFARFKNLEHAIRLLIWLTKKLGSDKNAPGPMFRWEWEKVAPVRAPEPPKMPEHEVALRNQLADFQKEHVALKARLRESEEKVKSLTMSLTAATSKEEAWRTCKSASSSLRNKTCDSLMNLREAIAYHKV